ncbi:hypothetical protein NHG29_03045 [Aerococcaceae bacterium NML160702]|nr:hypothetical protein [Aerococcaceae bacterium NML160702]
MDELISAHLESAAWRERQTIMQKVIELREPYIRRLLVGETMTEQEIGYLNAMADIMKELEARNRDVDVN